MDHIYHFSRKMSYLSSITLFLQAEEWRIAQQNLSFAISCNKCLSFGFFLSLSNSSLSAWRALSLSLSLARALSICVSFFVTKLCLLSNSLHVSSLSFVCFLFLPKSHSLFFLFSSVTYFPLLSFRSSFTLLIVY